MPKRAPWRVERPFDNASDPLDDQSAIDGFHHITLSVVAGRRAARASQGRLAEPQEFTVQLSTAHGARENPGTRFHTLFGNAHLATPAVGTQGAGKITFSQPVLDKVSLAVSLAGASSAAVSAEVRCTLRPEAQRDWQNAVYDLLFDAWRAWDREWRLQQTQSLGPQLSAIDASSPARNLQIISEELRRQVVTWLMNDKDFKGVDAMTPTSAKTWDRYTIDTARATAPTIQFLEQALEWGNLSYVCYPYYWARGSEWDDLVSIEGADPNLVNFLRSGSARVVVPARPGFELAILHWLIYQAAVPRRSAAAARRRPLRVDRHRDPRPDARARRRRCGRVLGGAPPDDAHVARNQTQPAEERDAPPGQASQPATRPLLLRRTRGRSPRASAGRTPDTSSSAKVRIAFCSWRGGGCGVSLMRPTGGSSCRGTPGLQHRP